MCGSAQPNGKGRGVPTKIPDVLERCGNEHGDGDAQLPRPGRIVRGADVVYQTLYDRHPQYMCVHYLSFHSSRLPEQSEDRTSLSSMQAPLLHHAMTTLLSLSTVAVTSSLASWYHHGTVSCGMVCKVTPDNPCEAQIITIIVIDRLEHRSAGCMVPAAIAWHFPCCREL